MGVMDLHLLSGESYWQLQSLVSFYGLIPWMLREEGVRN